MRPPFFKIKVVATIALTAFFAEREVWAAATLTLPKPKVKSAASGAQDGQTPVELEKKIGSWLGSRYDQDYLIELLNKEDHPEIKRIILNWALLFRRDLKYSPKVTPKVLSAIGIIQNCRRAFPLEDPRVRAVMATIRGAILWHTDDDHLRASTTNLNASVPNKDLIGYSDYRAVLIKEELIDSLADAFHYEDARTALLKMLDWEEKEEKAARALYSAAEYYPEVRKKLIKIAWEILQRSVKTRKNRMLYNIIQTLYDLVSRDKEVENLFIGVLTNETGRQYYFQPNISVYAKDSIEGAIKALSAVAQTNPRAQAAIESYLNPNDYPGTHLLAAEALGINKRVRIWAPNVPLMINALLDRPLSEKLSKKEVLALDALDHSEDHLIAAPYISMEDQDNIINSINLNSRNKYLLASYAKFNSKAKDKLLSFFHNALVHNSTGAELLITMLGTLAGTYADVRAELVALMKTTDANDILRRPITFELAAWVQAFPELKAPVEQSFSEMASFGHLFDFKNNEYALIVRGQSLLAKAPVSTDGAQIDNADEAVLHNKLKKLLLLNQADHAHTADFEVELEGVASLYEFELSNTWFGQENLVRERKFLERFDDGVKFREQSISQSAVNLETSKDFSINPAPTVLSSLNAFQKRSTKGAVLTPVEKAKIVSKANIQVRLDHPEIHTDDQQFGTLVANEIIKMEEAAKEEKKATTSNTFEQWRKETIGWLQRQFQKNLSTAHGLGIGFVIDSAFRGFPLEAQNLTEIELLGFKGKNIWVSYRGHVSALTVLGGPLEWSLLTDPSSDGTKISQAMAVKTSFQTMIESFQDTLAILQRFPKEAMQARLKTQATRALPTRGSDEFDLLTGYLWWGIKKDPNFWRKIEARARETKRPVAVFRDKSFLHDDVWDFESTAASHVSTGFEWSLGELLASGERSSMSDPTTLEHNKTADEIGHEQTIIHFRTERKNSSQVTNWNLGYMHDFLSEPTFKGPLSRKFTSKADFTIFTERPQIPSGNLILIPKPDDSKLSSLSVYDEKAEGLELGKDYRIIQNRRTGDLAIQLLADDRHVSGVLFKAQFLTEASPPVPPEHDLITISRVRQSTKWLDGIGLKPLPEHLRNEFAKQSTVGLVSIQRLADQFLKEARYTYRPHISQQEEKDDPKNPLAKYSKKVALDGRSYYQCSDSAELFKDYLSTSYGPHPSIIIETRLSYAQGPGDNSLTVANQHARVFKSHLKKAGMYYPPQKYDTTPTEIDPESPLPPAKSKLPTSIPAWFAHAKEAKSTKRLLAEQPAMTLDSEVVKSEEIVLSSGPDQDSEARAKEVLEQKLQIVSLAKNRQLRDALTKDLVALQTWKKKHSYYGSDPSSPIQRTQALCRMYQDFIDGKLTEIGVLEQLNKKFPLKRPDVGVLEAFENRIQHLKTRLTVDYKRVKNLRGIYSDESLRSMLTEMLRKIEDHLSDFRTRPSTEAECMAKEL